VAPSPLSRQIVLSGQISDGLSGTRLRAVPQIDFAGPQGLLLQVKADGVYSVSAQPDIAMPVAGDRISLLLRAEGYQPAAIDVLLTLADLDRIGLDINPGGGVVEIAHFRNLPVTRDITLNPRPVNLKGRVNDAEDPATAIAGATIRVTAPAPTGPVQTDDLGHFSLPDLPVAAEVTLRIEAAGFVAADISYRPDFNQPINHGAFALSSL
jgi:Carboxypeptidase regulatory-like domain